MRTILTSLIIIAVAALMISAIVLVIRQIIAFIKGDQDQLDRLTIPYDIAEMLAKRDFGISSEVFELRWNELKEARPDALPYDIYLELRDGQC